MATTYIIKNLRKFLGHGERAAKLVTAYYRKLIKATTLLSIVPAIVLIIMIIYGRISISEGFIGVITVMIGSVFFAKPYIEDLSTLTSYVEQLVRDKNVNMPSLSFLGSVEELSASVQNLHNSWEKKKLSLEAAIAESTILFDTIPDILMMIGEDMQIIRANKAARSVFGRNLKDMNFTHVIQELSLHNLIQSVIKGKKGANIEIAITSHNVKRDFQVNIEKFPLYSIGGIAVVMVMHDVTEAKRSRQMIKDFVANASHEIRTPLTSISGFIENLLEMEEDKATRKKFLDIMHEQSERMGALVNDLLSLSKVEMSEGTIPIDKIELSTVIKSTIRRLSHLAENKNMQIIYEQDITLPEINGDEKELSQVFTNIIGNAIKYGYSNTKINISSIISKKFPESEHHIFKNCSKIIAIAVTDEGEGIPAEHLPRITERFYRVDKTRSRNISGSGLGLSIVKHILNRHRAELTIESIEGKGSTFTIYMPVFE